MIEVFYNLKSLPFQKSIDTDSLFQSAAGKEMHKRLQYMKEKRGIMLITGMPGAGKTVHLRQFVHQLNPNHYKYFYLPLSTLNIMDFYRQLAVALGAQGCWRKSQLFQAIQDAIKHYVSNNKKIPIIIFDEAHLMKNENFFELQIISNFTMDSCDPALFVLVGQPHLQQKLLGTLHQAFNQRIALKFQLQPLSKEETGEYIQHQLQIAGAKEGIFNPNAVEAIFKNSAGVPRLINALAYKCLTLGALEHKEMISEEDVFRASQEL